MNINKKLYFAHQSSFIEKNVFIGNNSKIWHFCHIREGAIVGANCTLGKDVFIDKKVHIGDGCKIQNSVSVFAGVTLEDGVFCGPSCVFTNVINPRAFTSRMKEIVPTIVKTGATIGANDDSMRKYYRTVFVYRGWNGCDTGC